MISAFKYACHFSGPTTYVILAKRLIDSTTDCSYVKFARTSRGSDFRQPDCTSSHFQLSTVEATRATAQGIHGFY